MGWAKKRILTAAIVCCVFFGPSIVFGQDTGNVLINTNPQGSLVRLSGELNLSGVTPVRFDRALSGEYRVNVIREGYEKYSSVAYFSETQSSQLDITLVPKRRVKAFFRSLIIPGWGQKYYGNSTKATLYALGTLASAIGYVIVKDDYDSKVDDYNERKTAFSNATHWNDLPRLEAELLDAQEKANDAEDLVNIMTAVTIGVYALNLLDSFLFFPEYSRYTEYRAITAKPDIDADRVGISVAVKF